MAREDTDALLEAALEIAYGDGERDPGPVIDGLRGNPDALNAVRDAATTAETLRAATRPDAAGDGARRLQALVREAESPVAAPAPPVVHDVAAGTSGAAARARLRWFGVAVLAAAAAILLTLRLRQATPAASPAPAPELADARADVGTQTLDAFAADATPQGLGFAGNALTPAARGYLLALARDAQLAAAGAGGAGARVLASNALEQLTRDLEPAVLPATAAAQGCPALYPDAAGRAICEHGATLYRVRRDLGTDAGDRRLRTPATQAALAWLAGLSLPEATVPPSLRSATGDVSGDERAAWKSLLQATRAILEASAE